MTIPKNKMLVELDAFLDTRLGAMRIFSEGLWAKTWQDPAYYNRLIDDFDHYGPGTTVMWRGIYNQRGTLRNEKGELAVLKASVMSTMVANVGSIVRGIYARMTSEPTFRGTDIVVNIWPYELDQIDKDEIIYALEEMLLPDEEEFEAAIVDTVITCESISPEELTLDKVREDYSQVIMYNFTDWWDVQAANILKAERGATLTEFIVPEMLREKVSKRKFKDHNGEPINPFVETKRTLSVSMQLKFWSPAYFSVPCPHDLFAPDPPA